MCLQHAQDMQVTVKFKMCKSRVILSSVAYQKREESEVSLHTALLLKVNILSFTVQINKGS